MGAPKSEFGLLFEGRMEWSTSDRPAVDPTSSKSGLGVVTVGHNPALSGAGPRLVAPMTGDVV